MHTQKAEHCVIPFQEKAKLICGKKISRQIAYRKWNELEVQEQAKLTNGNGDGSSVTQRGWKMDERILPREKDIFYILIEDGGYMDV